MESAQQAYDRWSTKLAAESKEEVRVGGRRKCACFWGLRVRTQLLLSYGLATVVVYAALFLLCVLTTMQIRDSVVSDSLRALTDQIVDNSGIVLQEATSALQAKLSGSLATLVSPAAYALTDRIAGVSKLSSVPSHSDAMTSYLEAPLVTHDRYTCHPNLPTPADAAARGCMSSGRQMISVSASSLYVQGSNPGLENGFGVRPGAPRPDAQMVDASTVMDFFVPGTWAAANDSVDVFMALAGSPSLFRQYPGAVGDLAADSAGYRTYDPTSRSWYTTAASVYTSGALTAASGAQLPPKRPITISPPYSDQFGRGYMLTLSTLLVNERGNLLGVGGTDLHLSTLRELVTFITSRETGEAHLFHVSSDTVVASRQFLPGTPPPQISSLSLPGAGAGASSLTLGSVSPSVDNQCAAAPSGSYEWTAPDGKAYQFVWMRLLGDGYCLVTVTPTEEIQRPIVSQLDTIHDTASKLVVIVSVVSAICLVLVLSCVVVVSFRLARPLMLTASESTKIVRNLGGDLFDGVQFVPEPKQGQCALGQLLLNDPGEVASLRTEFIRILTELMAKRQKKPPPVNPLYAMAARRPVELSSTLQNVDTAAKSAMGGVALDAPPAGLGAPPPAAETNETNATNAAAADTNKPTVVDVAGEEDRTPAVQLTRWNAISSQFGAKLLLPMSLGLLFIITYNSVVLFSNVSAWTDPVRATMVNEEFANLNVRAFERANFVEQYLAMSIGSLTVVDSFANQLLVNRSVPYSGLQTSYFSPTSMCSQAGVTGTTATYNKVSCARPTTVFSDRHPTIRANYGSSVVYAPPTPLPLSIKEPDTGAVVEATSPASISAFIREQQLNSLLDNAFRAAYFGSEITYAYAAYHQTETYRQYPYMRLDSFAYPSPKPCHVAPTHRIGAYTPLCREWYKNAVDAWVANGRTATTVFNPVASDLVSPGELFLSLSKALSTPSGELIGVVAVDVALADLSRQIGSTRLYQRGYAFVWDANGKGVVHKNYKKEQNSGIGPVDVSLLDAGSDANFRAAMETHIIRRGRITGNWSNYWLNPDTGIEERWYYSFCPVHGTPYMLALTVVDQEVTARADEEIDKLKGWVTTQVVISVFLCLAAICLLLAFTWVFIKRFARPVMKLHSFVSAWGGGDYRHNIDAGLVDSASSWELKTITGNLSKLLVALRFGNPSYSARTVGAEKEKQNTLKAFSIIGEALRSRDPPAHAAKGVGAVFNNLALSAGAQDRRVRSENFEPIPLFGEAIDNVKVLQSEARQTSGREAEVAAFAETLALRLLNKALWVVNEQKDGPRAAGIVREAASSAPTLSVLGAVTSNLSFRSLCCGVGGTKDQLLSQVVQDLALQGLEEACKQPVPYERAGDFADICVALCDMGCPTLGTIKAPQLAAWTLEHVPSLSNQTMMRLALHARDLHIQGYQAALDEVMSSANESWNPKDRATGVAAWQEMSQGPRPKVVLFVLDLSYSMDADNRLTACKAAMLSVLDEHCAENDRIGLITFADDVRYEFQLGPKDLSAMQRNVNSMRTRGRTAFYSAVLQALTDLQKLGSLEPTTPKWVIALTDGDDNRSKPSDLPSCLPILSQSPQLNLALITVGGEIRSTNGYDQLIGATTSGRFDNKGILINAANSDQISEAFGKVAAAMNAGVAEVL